MIDLDELARIRPAEPNEHAWTDLVTKNLGAVWPNYQDLGIDRLVLAGLVTSPETMDTYVRAIPGADVTVCRVHAPFDTLDARLRRREPGTVRSFLLEVAPGLDEQIASQAFEDIAIDSRPGRDISEAARSVLEHLGWPLSTTT